MKRTVRTENQAGAPVFRVAARRDLDGIARIVDRIAPRPVTVEASDQELFHPESLADITTERDEYVGVPFRSGTIEGSDQELSHPESLAGITAERDEYVGVPRRPGTVETAAEELSHRALTIGFL